MKIYLFGSTGMLGNYVKNVLDKSFELVCITRERYDILHDSVDVLEVVMKGLNKDDVVVNCAGIIPQTTNPREYRSYIRVNALFPHELQRIVERNDSQLIHITTDCVFDGKKGSSYDENDIPTDTSIYGVSKSLGEPQNACVIRTSIIGEELKTKKSLLEWIKSNENKSIPGFSNHLWNGVTCLELAKVILKMVNESFYWKGVRHIYSPDVISKYELCKLIICEFKLTIDVTKDFEKNVDKSLRSIFDVNVFDIPNISFQIKDLFNFKHDFAFD